MPVRQAIPGRYIDKSDLATLLVRLFSGNFKVKVTEDNYIITVPRTLTDVRVLSVVQHGKVLTKFAGRDRYDYTTAVISKNTEWPLVRSELASEALTWKVCDDGGTERQNQCHPLQKLPKPILRSKAVPLHQLDEITLTVFRKGRLIFAILILIDHLHYITNFIENDQLQPELLDHKLPFDLQTLEAMMTSVHASQFHEKQWELIAPIFKPFVLRRHLADDTILPFHSEVKIGEGGFGDVYRITVNPAHQKFDASVQQLVRKDLQSHVVDYETELQNLSILRLLQHPNISKLLGCYTYRGVHSFLFAEALGGDLHKFLRSPAPVAFADNSSFLVALAGLASAVANVHNFVVNKLPLAYIGCHHDLKASNILVEKQRFILSDFGLARLKLPAEGSTTPARVRHGFSIAPECQTLDGKFERHLVHRASDIWSLGCIMLDVATYMLQGPGGVSKFETRREFEIGQFEYSYFHKGNESNPAVKFWIDDLHTQSGMPEKLLLTLISQMLQLQPEQRPGSLSVEASMIRIALFSLSRVALEMFSLLCEADQFHEVSVEPWVEKLRFESWMKTLGFPTSTSESYQIHADHLFDYSQFEVVSSHLETLIQELRTIVRQRSETNRRILLPLRHLNTVLYDQLPQQQREKAIQISEILLLGNERFEDLEKMRTGDATGNFDKVAMLARSKNNIHAVELGLSSSMRYSEILAPTVEKGSLGQHGLGWVQDDDGKKTRVLIEFKGYSDARLRSRLHARMGEITQLCQSIQDCESVGLLQCRGFFLDDKREAFGLVYNFPEATDGPRLDCKPTLLYKYMSDKKSIKPPLGYRFQLAYRIAVSLSEVHKIGWVHKGLTSSNIALFPQSATIVTPQDRPYLVGFRHSRPDDPAGFTEGPPLDQNVKAYQHPQYLERNERYFLHYDYYSLGMVLLEIGIWLPLKDMIQKHLSSEPEEIRKKILENRVPALGHLMGATYQSVVEACLADEFMAVKDKGEGESSRRCQLQFQANVLDRLSKLASLDI